MTVDSCTPEHMKWLTMTVKLEVCEWTQIE